ncbi:ubiquitin fusion degradation 1-like protein isoform X1 [Chlorella sorokiniana]|uniref:Ubiquitin fusion degradation 1-like protein isoform X1 n=1 Tax=Chlorella sorokiniana TaxID=3076 RepID=A0A2P6U0G8_CHLSO|nr:ubiquitin fusion degradation 1-like protein isoform X1 [Chlorella sorokiniana]|eukprot:PRW59790.1 ubiquitin fusion degradation 1-like protein isoform X1 [Chlorella sorokiniana]
MFGFGGFGYGGPGGGRFEASYRCYPVSFLDKPEAERGDKIFLPPSALDRLAQLHIDYPMLFQVENRRDARSTHCGVLEFVADEGMVYMPYWMMENLLLQEGDVVTLRSATLPKGTFVKLQPHSTDFLDISNPRAVLETTLRNFSCLTVGDTIPINYNNKRYFIDIIEAKPGQAISVIETDCNVDFAPPLDYVEPQRQPQQPVPMAADVPAAAGAAAAEPAPAEPEEPKFLAFAGTGRRLDGKAVSESRPIAIPLAGTGRPGASTSGPGSAAGSVGGSEGPGSAAGSAPKRPGKVFGGNRLQAKLAEKQAGGGAGRPPQPQPTPAEKKEEEEEPKFKAFSGKGYSLKG